MPQELTSPLFLEDDSVYARLLKDIANAVFVGGDRLVTTKLSEKYKTSVNPVREALKQLQGEGFVTVSPNSGARVTKFEYNTIRDVFEILQLLDPYLIEWFVSEHTPEQRDELQALVEQMEAMDEQDHISFRNLDTQFHWLMYSQHYNKTAVELWRQKRLVLQIMHSNFAVSQVRVEQSIAEHKVILANLAKRDVAGTLAILSKHITASGQYWSRQVNR
ncbi:MAG: GntR family transcriptional regulator [Thalassotalea sp.]